MNKSANDDIGCCSAASPSGAPSTRVAPRRQENATGKRDGNLHGMLALPTAAAVGLSLRQAGSLLPTPARAAAPTMTATALTPTFTSAGVNTELKLSLLSLAANLDRGQSYNPTSSDAYKERMDTATKLVEALVAASPPLPTSLDALDGEWELVYTNVAHGIFRSSPFFLAIQQAYANDGVPEKAELFFKLHELQTCSWGISKIGRLG